MTLLTVFFLGCGESNKSTVQNPSGDCVAEDNGARQCYHSPMNEETYLPDCQTDLSREYWRVFAMTETSAYIIPRPDGMGLVYNLCEDGSVSDLMNTYGLCTETLSSAEVAVINDIPPADALRITNALHANLLFIVDDNDMLNPWAAPNDIVDACQLSDVNDDVLSDFCTQALGYYDSGDDCPSIAMLPSAEEAQVLAARLNTLYGLDLPAN